MALKPTIFKFDVSLSDVDCGRYEHLNLTVAQHPSETAERMMARLLAFCLNADAGLAFAGGLASAEEPDIWLRGLDGQVIKWIDVGEPSLDRLRKASRMAREVLVYSFNTKSDLWWARVGAKAQMPNLSIIQFDWSHLQQFTGLLQRTLSLSIGVTDQSAFIAAMEDSIEVEWRTLKHAD